MTFDKPAFKGDDYDFAAGSVKGLRSWSMDEKGRLRGITHPAIWLPAENVSTCRARTRCPQAPTPSFGGYRLWIDDTDLTGEALIKPCSVKGCAAGYHPSTHTFDPDCECGFWAYDERGFDTHGDVSGVIEGYGKTTIGTQGFRCEKAKIVALCRENFDTGDLMRLSKWLRLQALYPAARFYEGFDDMVAAHGEVLHAWEPVGEDFWTEDSAPESKASAQLAALQAQLNQTRAQIANQMARYTYPPTRRWRTGGVA